MAWSRSLAKMMKSFLFCPRKKDVSLIHSVNSDYRCQKNLLPSIEQKNFMSSFEKATAIWNKCNLPKSAEIIFNICKRNLVTPCITRWNSLFESLPCLLKFERCTLKDLCQKLYLPELSESKVEFLREYCTVLEPIAMTIHKVQGEQFSFHGYAIPVLRQTETSLKTIQDQSLKYNAPLVQAALRGMQKRFQPYLQQDFMVVIHTILATISHPYFKLKPILKEKRDALKQELIDTASKLSSNVSEDFKCNKSSDTLFHWSDDEEETPQTQKNLTSIEVL